MRKAIFIIIDIDCVSCSLTIDGDLEDTKGVCEAKTNYAKAQTAVQFDPQLISEKQILAIIKKSGYTAKLQSATN